MENKRGDLWALMLGIRQACILIVASIEDFGGIQPSSSALWKRRKDYV